MGKKIAKWAGVVLAAVFTTSVLGSAGAKAEENSANPFRDIQSGHWAASGISKGVAKGYVAGYTNGTFKPDVNVTRAEFVKMVVSALDVEIDTQSERWYTPYVSAAVDKGLYTTDDFASNDKNWNQKLTREEMSRIAGRALGEKSKENDKWMYIATKKGLMTGVGRGQLAPDRSTTRAQAVVVIERILSVNAGETLQVDKYAVGNAELLWHGTNIFTVMPEMFVVPEEKLKPNGKSEAAEFWHEKRMTLTSRDEMYQGQLDALIAIDLADPNDPNLKWLPPIEELQWYNNRGNQNMMDLPVKDQKNSYILYFKTHTVYNKKPEAYSTTRPPQLSISGFESPDRDAFFDKGVLNALAWVYHKQMSDTSAYIVPKTGYRKGPWTIIDLVAPAFSNYGYKSNRILDI